MPPRSPPERRDFMVFMLARRTRDEREKEREKVERKSRESERCRCGKRNKEWTLARKAFFVRWTARCAPQIE
jgi:hypothetical protein